MKWLVEVVNQRDEIVCVATILTLVAKQSPFIDLNLRSIQKTLNGLTETTQANWGKMSPQHMLEHLEDGILVSLGEPEADQCFTAEENLEKWQDSLYTHRKMPKDFLAPFMNADGSLQELRHKNLDAAKQSFLENLKKFVIYYKENPEAEHMNYVFGKLNKEMWELLHKKHFTHHFEQFGLI